MENLQPSTAKQFKSLWKLGGLTPWQLVRNVFGEIGTNHSLGRASELAFDFLFALFPLILLMVTLFGLFTSRSVELQNHLLSYFGDLLPPAAFQLLRATATELAANASGGKLTFDIVFALWFASGGLNSMISALTLASSVREARSRFKVRTIALGLTTSFRFFSLPPCFCPREQPFCRLVRDRTSIATDGRLHLEDYSVAGCYPLRYYVVFGAPI
jgi:membrane protein